LTYPLPRLAEGLAGVAGKRALPVVARSVEPPNESIGVLARGLGVEGGMFGAAVGFGVGGSCGSTGWDRW
jgi:hypothetical protein